MKFGNLLQEYENQEVQRLLKMRDASVPQFRAGDTLCVKFKASGSGSKRLQSFEGVCIARHNRSLGSTVTLRRVFADVGVEKTFALFDPNIVSIDVIKFGKVRRAKLYYLRKLSGKKARIKERQHYFKAAKKTSTTASVAQASESQSSVNEEQNKQGDQISQETQT